MIARTRCCRGQNWHVASKASGCHEEPTDCPHEPSRIVRYDRTGHLKSQSLGPFVRPQQPPRAADFVRPDGGPRGPAGGPAPSGRAQASPDSDGACAGGWAPTGRCEGSAVTLPRAPAMAPGEAYPPPTPGLASGARRCSRRWGRVTAANPAACLRAAAPGRLRERWTPSVRLWSTPESPREREW